MLFLSPVIIYIYATQPQNPSYQHELELLFGQFKSISETQKVKRGRECFVIRYLRSTQMFLHFILRKLQICTQTAQS